MMLEESLLISTKKTEAMKINFIASVFKLKGIIFSSLP